MSISTIFNLTFLFRGCNFSFQIALSTYFLNKIHKKTQTKSGPNQDLGNQALRNQDLRIRTYESGPNQEKVKSKIQSDCEGIKAKTKFCQLYKEKFSGIINCFDPLCSILRKYLSLVKFILTKHFASKLKLKLTSREKKMTYNSQVGMDFNVKTSRSDE